MKEKITKLFENINLQARAWKFYGIFTPLFFLLIFISFHLKNPPVIKSVKNKTTLIADIQKL
jgi:hypothetical protein